MTLSRFARMCETIENSNGKADTIEQSLSAFSDIPSVLKILSLGHAGIIILNKFI